MIKKQVLGLLNVNREALKKFSINAIYLFGSVARDEEGPESDIDILVSFTGPATFDQYMELKFYLEDLLGRKVDLVTEGGLRKELKAYVEKDLIRAA